MLMKILYAAVLCLMPVGGFAQNPTQVDSLKSKLLVAKSDTDKLNICTDLSQAYLWSDNDSALFYAVNAIAIAKKIDAKWAIIAGTVFKFIAEGLKRDDRAAIQTFYEAQNFVNQNKDLLSKSFFLEWAGIFYNILEDYRKSLAYLFSYDSSLKASKRNADPDAFELIAQDYYGLDMPDSALFYANLGLRIYLKN